MKRTPELPTIYLRPGELAIVREPTLITTVLGSCVSFTFFHRPLGLAGICHALLPSGECQDAFRYVDCSGSHLLEAFLARGVRRHDIEVKLFGGADMFDGGTPGAIPRVGAQNVEAARTFLDKERLRLRSSDVGGRRGRKILFQTGTGEVLLKRLHKEQIPPGCGASR